MRDSAHNDTNAIDNHGGEGSVSSSSEIHNQSPLVQALMTCLSPLVRLRCQYEWFYSTIDRYELHCDLLYIVICYRKEITTLAFSWYYLI